METAGRVVLAMMAAASGFVWLYAGSLSFQGHSPLPREPRTIPRWNWLVVLVALSLVSYTVYTQVSARKPDDDKPVVVTLQAVQATCMLSLVVIVVLLALLLLRRDDHLADFGIHLKKWPSQIAIGCMGFLASLLPVFLAVRLTLTWRNAENQHPFLTFLQANLDPTTIAWIMLAVVVLAPLAEELQYRVILQGWLQTLVPSWIAIPVVALIFSAVHGFPDAVPLFPLALVLGYVFDRRQSYLCVVIIHALFNAWNLVLVVASESSTMPAAAWLIQ